MASPLRIPEVVKDMPYAPQSAGTPTLQIPRPQQVPKMWNTFRVLTLVGTAVVPTVVAVLRPSEWFVVTGIACQIVLIGLSGKAWLTD